MRKIRELLRLKHNGRSHRQIASSLSVAVGTVCGQLKRAREAGVTWERAEMMTDAELEALVFRDGGRNVAATRSAIDYGHVHGELRRNGVTLQLLWAEYVDGVAARSDTTKPYQYSQFVCASRGRVAGVSGGSHAGPHDESIGMGHTGRRMASKREDSEGILQRARLHGGSAAVVV